MSVLESALAEPRLILSAQDALAKLAATSQVGERVSGVLVAFANDHLASVDPRVIRQLALADRQDVVEVLGKALSYPALRTHAKDALEVLGEGSSAVAPAARSALFTPLPPDAPPPSTITAVTAETAAAPTATFAVGPSATPHPSSESAFDTAFERLGEQVARGHATLLLGPGIHVPPPDVSAFADAKGNRPLLGSALSRRLAQLCDLGARLPGEDPGKQYERNE